MMSYHSVAHFVWLFVFVAYQATFRQHSVLLCFILFNLVECSYVIIVIIIIIIIIGLQMCYQPGGCGNTIRHNK
jgi:uncharacterized membrane protein